MMLGADGGYIVDPGSCGSVVQPQECVLRAATMPVDALGKGQKVRVFGERNPARGMGGQRLASGCKGDLTPMRW